MASRFQRMYPPTRPASSQALWFPFQNHKLLVQEQNGKLALLQGDESILAELSTSPEIVIGMLDDTPCIACEISSEQVLPEGWRAIDLRSLFGQGDDDM